MEFMCEDKDKAGEEAYPLVTETAKEELADGTVVLASVPLTEDGKSHIVPGRISTAGEEPSVVFFYTTIWERLDVTPMQEVPVAGTSLRLAYGPKTVPHGRSSDRKFSSIFEGEALMQKFGECIEALLEKDEGFKAALNKSKNAFPAFSTAKWPRAEFLKRSLNILTTDLSPKLWESMRPSEPDKVPEHLARVWKEDLFTPSVAAMTSASMDQEAIKAFSSGMGQGPTNAKFVCMLMDMLTEACQSTTEAVAPSKDAPQA
jgi:hypothetical protein